MCKYREMNGLGDFINADLTYAVDFNLAHMYHINKNYKEAIDLFTGVFECVHVCVHAYTCMCTRTPTRKLSCSLLVFSASSIPCQGGQSNELPKLTVSKIYIIFIHCFHSVYLLLLLTRRPGAQLRLTPEPLQLLLLLLLSKFLECALAHNCRLGAQLHLPPEPWRPAATLIQLSEDMLSTSILLLFTRRLGAQPRLPPEPWRPACEPGQHLL